MYTRSPTEVKPGAGPLRLLLLPEAFRRLLVLVYPVPERRRTAPPTPKHSRPPPLDAPHPWLQRTPTWGTNWATRPLARSQTKVHPGCRPRARSWGGVEGTHAHEGARTPASTPTRGDVPG